MPASADKIQASNAKAGIRNAQTRILPLEVLFMSDFFSKMNEDYARKHFPNGSVFEGVTKSVKGISIFSLFFFALLFTGATYGLIWAIGRTVESISEGDRDLLGIGIGICVFFALVVMGCLVMLYLLIKQARKKRGDHIAEAAKKSKLPKSEIEAFERQAVASDCYILNLTSGLDRLLSTGTYSHGLLTRDYIYLANAYTVIRVDDLKACCFSEYTYYVKAGKSSKKIHNLAIYLFASNGVCTFADTTEKAGLALMALLKERNSAIDTNDGKFLPEGAAFDEYKKRILKEQ